VSLTIFISMFAIGLATSVHCISMCGPMVVTYAVKSDGGDRWHKRVLANVAYQGAKLMSYLLVGLALGAIGAAFNLNAIRPYVMLVAGLFMVILGLGMTGKVPWAARLTPRPPRVLINALSKLRRRSSSDVAAGESSLATPIAFGLLTGLMPCAPLQAAELAAASSGTVLGGGTVMVAFGLGTLPLLFAFGTASSLIPIRWKRRLMFGLAFVVIGLGLVFLNRTALLLDFPVNSHTIQAAILGTPTASPASTNYVTGDDGVVEVRLTVANGHYDPSVLSIPAGRPVRLIVSRPESDPCSAQLLFPRLGINKDLTSNGVTTIELPATKAGTFTMTCGMGMISGQLVVGGGGGPGVGVNPWLWVAVTLAAVAAALWLALGIRPRRQTAGPLRRRRAPPALEPPEIDR
jgi:uncharacterized protein